MEEEKSNETKSSYGKRSLWQWIALYVVIAIIVYGIIYYVFIHKQNSYTTQANSAQQAQQTAQTQPSENSVYKMVSKGKLGTVMTDQKGMTLYTYAQDTSGVSNCNGKCLQIWPPYKAQSESGTSPANISVIKRSDGTLQYAWKGMPLYYYTKDGDSGDAYGNGIGGVWSVIK